MKQPLVSNEQADRWMLRQAIRPDVERAAAAVWWGIYTVQDATQELRGQAQLKARTLNLAAALANDVAASAFDEAMQRHETEHETSLRVMETAALAILSAGKSDALARAQIKQHAKDRPIPPPLHLLQQAYDNAKRRHAWSKKPQRVV